ncbi:hypothetical protein PLESTM_001327000 [Pleodorina starrii]|nr:hypothetical protein PLESTM_001327000 [Pleodorina starrii]
MSRYGIRAPSAEISLTLFHHHRQMTFSSSTAIVKWGEAGAVAGARDGDGGAKSGPLAAGLVAGSLIATIRSMRRQSAADAALQIAELVQTGWVHLNDEAFFYLHCPSDEPAKMQV